MSPEALPPPLRDVPELFHVCRAASWEAIRREGLLSVEHLVRRAGLPDDEADRLLAARRPHAQLLADGRTWIRDQQPLRESLLARMLDDMTVEQYLRRLNGLAFLWADRTRATQLAGLPRYTGEPQVLLTVRTASLVAAHRDRIVLTRINSGATVFPSGRRGTHTFRRIDEVGAREKVVEVAVEGAIPDLADHVLCATRM